MLHNKRRNVFETNSSSSHSITIADSGVLKNHLVCVDNKIVSTGGEFGWGVEEFTDAKTKIDYLVTELFCNHVDKKGIHWKKLNDLKRHRYTKLCKAVKDFTGCDLEIKVNNDEYFPIGYIDHQSRGVANEILDATVGKIKRFIFNPKSVLLIAHDNV